MSEILHAIAIITLGIMCGRNLYLADKKQSWINFSLAVVLLIWMFASMVAFTCHASTDLGVTVIEGQEEYASHDWARTPEGWWYTRP
ncbi:MAG: hypothetical protein AB9866_18855 [Syntrophobacteraceae bacterium]